MLNFKKDRIVKDYDVTIEENIKYVREIMHKISSIPKSKRQAIIALIEITKTELTNILITSKSINADVIREHIKYLDALCFNIKNAEEKFMALKEEEEPMDTLSTWGLGTWFGRDKKEDKEAQLAAMKLGIDVDELHIGGKNG
jgi:hypothetical protein